MPKGLALFVQKVKTAIFSPTASTIQMEGYRTLKAGQQVDYEVESGPKGSHASSVVPVEGSAAK